MSNFKKLQNLLLREISATLAKRGFDGKPSGQTFYARKPFGWVAFHLAFIPHDDTDFDVTADVALRITAVESMVNDGNKLLSDAEKSKTATLGGELGNLSEGKQRRWNIASEAAVKPTAEGIQTAMESIAFPYIERYSNLDEVLCVLSKNERSAWLHSPIHGARCQRALALAVVLKKYDHVDELIQQSEAFLKSLNDFGLRSFQQFAYKIKSSMKS